MLVSLNAPPTSLIPYLDVVMDEYMSDLYLVDLDLLGLEGSYRLWTFHVISPGKIQLLKYTLSKAIEKSKLVIQNILQKDPKKYLRDLKKRGRKMDLQHLNTLDTKLIELGQDFWYCLAKGG